jgi:hypothetical protein
MKLEPVMAKKKKLRLADLVDIGETRVLADALLDSGFDLSDVIDMIIEAIDDLIRLPPGRVGDFIEEHDAKVIRAWVRFAVGHFGRRRQRAA